MQRNRSENHSSGTIPGTSAGCSTTRDPALNNTCFGVYSANIPPRAQGSPGGPCTSRSQHPGDLPRGHRGLSAPRVLPWDAGSHPPGQDEGEKRGGNPPSLFSYLIKAAIAAENLSPCNVPRCRAGREDAVLQRAGTELHFPRARANPGGTPVPPHGAQPGLGPGCSERRGVNFRVTLIKIFFQIELDTRKHDASDRRLKSNRVADLAGGPRAPKIGF